MKIDQKLIEIGVDEYLIKLLHSKTKLKDIEIDEAKLIKSLDKKSLVMLKLSTGRRMVINYWKRKKVT